MSVGASLAVFLFAAACAAAMVMIIERFGSGRRS